MRDELQDGYLTTIWCTTLTPLLYSSMQTNYRKYRAYRFHKLAAPFRYSMFVYFHSKKFNFLHVVDSSKWTTQLTILLRDKNYIWSLPNLPSKWVFLVKKKKGTTSIHYFNILICIKLLQAT